MRRRGVRLGPVRGESIHPDGERKQVTVLFADVMGSMDMAEGQDPEQWREIMQRFFAILAEQVRRFEGTVDKFTGDGIMAIFGAPVAHEDHGRRAAYSALAMLDEISTYSGELRRRHGLNFSLRIGINSGEVVAGSIGEAGVDEYTAIGHTVGLAQRMEALAEPGKAYLTGSAADLVHGYFELDDLGEFEIKGSSHPIRVFELAGVGSVRSRLELSRERGFSRFVGRDEEMASLEGALDLARAGEGAVAAIRAEPGVGKSRLCHEFAESARAAGIEVFEAQAQPHGQESTFMPVLQMLRAYFGITDDDSDRAVREKIAGRTLLLDPEFVDDLPLLFDFLGVADPDRPVPQLSAEARERALRGIVCRLVRAPNRREPIVAIIEDLHWLDPGSEAMLGELLGSLAGTQTLVVVNFRPEHSPAWSPRPGDVLIDLTPLDREHTHHLIVDLAGDDPSLDGLPDLVHERTAGNPFFIEEIIRSLAESGHLEGGRGEHRLARPVEDAGVPPTVHAVLAARIDRLPADAKRLLQTASVAGKEVSGETLERISDFESPAECAEAVSELIAAGFLFELELYPERILAFRHPLTREVAYDSQLSDQRTSSHAAVARALADLNPERHEELAALIASHMEKGGEALEAARWAARAAYWAGTSRPHEALRLWETVARLTDELEAGKEGCSMGIASRLLQLDYAWRIGMDREQMERLEQEAEELATRISDLKSLSMLRMLQYGRPGLEQTTSRWVAGVQEAIRLADESGDDYLRVAMRAAGSYAYLGAGDFDGFDRAADEVLEMAGDDHRAGAGIIIGCPVAWALTAKAIVRRERGQFDECERLLDRGLRVAEEVGDPETASWNLNTKSLMLAMKGEAEAGVAVARENLKQTDKLGDVFSRSLALGNLSAVQLTTEDPEGALESIEEAERLHRRAMNSGGELDAWRAALHAEALAGVGRGEEALERAEWSVRVARERELRWSLPLGLLALARARAAAGRDGVGEALDESAEAAESIGAGTQLSAVEAARPELVSGSGAPSSTL